MDIIIRTADVFGAQIIVEGAEEIAKRSRGTPRIANRLLRRVRDFAQVIGNGIITREIADYALKTMEIDALGLDKTDKTMLEAMIIKFAGGPVGLDTIAAAISEEPETIEDVYEPYLLQLGFISRTPRGRIVMPLAYEHLKLPVPHKTNTLF
jgi:Holliday junction DNA helicase RuvB